MSPEFDVSEEHRIKRSTEHALSGLRWLADASFSHGERRKHKLASAAQAFGDAMAALKTLQGGG